MLRHGAHHCDCLSEGAHTGVCADQAFPPARFIGMRLCSLPVDFDRPICLSLLHECACNLKTQAKCVVGIGGPCNVESAAQRLIALSWLICPIVDECHLREVVGTSLHPLLNRRGNVLRG